MKNLLTAALTIVAMASANADPSDGQTIFGAGATSCGKYVNLYESHDKRLLLLIDSWVQGYLSDWNDLLVTRKLRPLNWVDPETIDAYIVKYCRENPLDTVHSATVNMIGDLQKRQ